MKKLVQLCLVVLASIFVLAACTEEKAIETPKQKGVFQYHTTVIGNNSDVTAIVNELPLHEFVDTLALQTKNEPYELTINFKNEDIGLTAEERDNQVVANAAYMFSLIENVEYIHFVFEDRTYDITKRGMQNWLGILFPMIKSEEYLLEVKEGMVDNPAEIKAFLDVYNNVN
jgi:hypothetical protein